MNDQLKKVHNDTLVPTRNPEKLARRYTQSLLTYRYGHWRCAPQDEFDDYYRMYLARFRKINGIEDLDIRYANNPEAQGRKDARHSMTIKYGNWRDAPPEEFEAMYLKLKKRYQDRLQYAIDNPLKLD